ncbi:hypothetical protein chiPu_0016414 [Chiloscyllium punctatum]|uniref:Glutathione peroxidase n=1 Tax=Chiloscyllium punctatum TaxID=137246 RepID=A0A401T5J7_CHIPU|nr:hypothetical protein [Chiloscyllium punctatum]
MRMLHRTPSAQVRLSASEKSKLTMISCTQRFIKRAFLVSLATCKERARTRAMSAQPEDWSKATSVYQFTITDIDGKEVNLEEYKGLLVELDSKYAEKGLRILAFPCNQFGKQEPGDEKQIKAFANTYNVKFGMSSKIDVNGDNAHPLWKWMKEQPKGKGLLGNAIKWNFTKFLIDREGQVVKRYSPMDDPVVIEKDLLKYL